MNEAMSFLYIQLYLTNQVSFQFKIKNKKKKKTSIVFPSFLDGKMKGQPDLCAFNKKIRQECVLGDLKVSVLQLVDMRVGLFKQSFFFAWQILKGEQQQNCVIGHMHLLLCLSFISYLGWQNIHYYKGLARTGSHCSKTSNFSSTLLTNVFVQYMCFQVSNL